MGKTYESIKAIVDVGGNLRWECEGRKSGTTTYDKKVHALSDEEIVALTAKELGLKGKEKDLVEVTWE